MIYPLPTLRRKSRHSLPQAAQPVFPRPVSGRTPEARRPSLPTTVERLLEPALSVAQWGLSDNRRTPSGLTEAEMLATFNYVEADSLTEFAGIGPSIAQAIVAFRSEQGYLSDLDEIVRIPRIGPKRFQLLVGRPCLYQEVKLHSLMRRAWEEPIRARDLSPWRQPAPGIAAIWLAPATERAARKEAAQAVGHDFIARKCGPLHLYFLLSLARESLTGRAAQLLKQLPHLLRHRLS